MISFPELRQLRVGCVPYLNARPLIEDYDGPVRFEHPSLLAKCLAAGELDAALTPIFEVLGPRRYVLVDGVGIASDGPVYSVILAYRGDLADVRTIALDPASLTSIHLVQVLLREGHGLNPQCVASSGHGSEAEARLLIGNQAIDFRAALPAGYRILDLGEEWQRQTGLPFVYALWALRQGLPARIEIAGELRSLQRTGRRRIPDIARCHPLYGAAFCERYFTQHLRFHLGSRERQGIEQFRVLLARHGFLSEAGEPLIYV
ncbi:MAG: menaquinone biosynthesis protein [Verrucomicrobiota bacterium]|nr:menaquinone biosynthesis protein [Verrucomicrobiota bacterium]